jgi:hypothetical protein
MKIIILWLACVLRGIPPAQASSCATLESRAEADVQALALAEEQSGAFRHLGDDALSAVRECPQSARLWYLAVRSAEVLEAPMNGRAFDNYGGLKRIAGDALTHAPNSAPVVTVAARVLDDENLARKAVTLDQGYQPARRALAELLAKTGAFEEALRYAVAGSPSDSMRLTRARVLLAAKRPAEAVSEARRVGSPGTPDELSPAVEVHRDQQEVLGFALLDVGKTSEGRKALEAAAASGSVAAQQYLARKARH